MAKSSKKIESFPVANHSTRIISTQSSPSSSLFLNRSDQDDQNDLKQLDDTIDENQFRNSQTLTSTTIINQLSSISSSLNYSTSNNSAIDRTIHKLQRKSALRKENDNGGSCSVLMNPLNISSLRIMAVNVNNSIKTTSSSTPTMISTARSIANSQNSSLCPSSTTTNNATTSVGNGIGTRQTPNYIRLNKLRVQSSTTTSSSSSSSSTTKTSSIVSTPSTSFISSPQTATKRSSIITSSPMAIAVLENNGNEILKSNSTTKNDQQVFESNYSDNNNSSIINHHQNRRNNHNCNNSNQSRQSHHNDHPTSSSRNQSKTNNPMDIDGTKRFGCCKSTRLFPLKTTTTSTTAKTIDTSAIINNNNKHQECDDDDDGGCDQEDDDKNTNNLQHPHPLHHQRHCHNRHRQQNHLHQDHTQNHHHHSSSISSSPFEVIKRLSSSTSGRTIVAVPRSNVNTINSKQQQQQQQHLRNNCRPIVTRMNAPYWMNVLAASSPSSFSSSNKKESRMKEKRNNIEYCCLNQNHHQHENHHRHLHRTQHRFDQLQQRPTQKSQSITSVNRNQSIENNKSTDRKSSSTILNNSGSDIHNRNDRSIQSQSSLMISLKKNRASSSRMSSANAADNQLVKMSSAAISSSQKLKQSHQSSSSSMKKSLRSIQKTLTKNIDEELDREEIPEASDKNAMKTESRRSNQKKSKEENFDDLGENCNNIQEDSNQSKINEESILKNDKDRCDMIEQNKSDMKSKQSTTGIGPKQTSREMNRSNQKFDDLIAFVEKFSPELLFLLNRSANLSYQLALFERKLDYLEKIFCNQSLNIRKNRSNQSDHRINDDGDGDCGDIVESDCDEEKNNRILWSKVIQRTRDWIEKSRHKNLFATKYELKSITISNAEIYDRFETMNKMKNFQRKERISSKTRNNSSLSVSLSSSSSSTSSSNDELIILLEKIAQFSTNILSQNLKNFSSIDVEPKQSIGLSMERTQKSTNNLDGHSESDRVFEETTTKEKHTTEIKPIVEKTFDVERIETFLKHMLQFDTTNPNDCNDFIREKDSDEIFQRLRPEMLKSLVQLVQTQTLLVQIQNEFDALMCVHVDSYRKWLTQENRSSNKSKIDNRTKSCDKNQSQRSNRGLSLPSLSIENRAKQSLKSRSNQLNQVLFQNQSRCKRTLLNQNQNAHRNQIKFNTLSPSDENPMCFANDCPKLQNNFVSDGDSGGEFTATTVTNDFNQFVTDEDNDDDRVQKKDSANGDELSSLLNQIAMCSQKIIEQTSGTSCNNSTNSTSCSSGCCCGSSIEAKCMDQYGALPIRRRQFKTVSMHPFDGHQKLSSSKANHSDYYLFNRTISENDGRTFCHCYFQTDSTNSFQCADVKSCPIDSVLNRKHIKSSYGIDPSFSSPNIISKSYVHPWTVGFAEENHPARHHLLQQHSTETIFDQNRVNNSLNNFLSSSLTTSTMFDMIPSNDVRSVSKTLTDTQIQTFNCLKQSQTQLPLSDPIYQPSSSCHHRNQNQKTNDSNARAIIFDPYFDVEKFLNEVKRELDENRFTSAPPFVVENAPHLLIQQSMKHQNPLSSSSSPPPSSTSSSSLYQCSPISLSIGSNRSYRLDRNHHYHHQNQMDCCQTPSSFYPIQNQAIITVSPMTTVTTTTTTTITNGTESILKRNSIPPPSYHSSPAIVASTSSISNHRSNILNDGNWRLNQRNMITIDDDSMIVASLCSDQQKRDCRQRKFPLLSVSQNMIKDEIEDGSCYRNKVEVFSQNFLNEYRCQIQTRAENETERHMQEIDQWLQDHLKLASANRMKTKIDNEPIAIDDNNGS